MTSPPPIFSDVNGNRWGLGSPVRARWWEHSSASGVKVSQEVSAPGIVGAMRLVAGDAAPPEFEVAVWRGPLFAHLPMLWLVPSQIELDIA